MDSRSLILQKEAVLFIRELISYWLDIREERSTINEEIMWKLHP